MAVLASAIDPFDPMDKAIHDLGRRFLTDTEHLHRDWTLARSYALTPALRAVSQAWAGTDAAAGDGVRTVASKGAPEAVADLCHLGVDDRRHIAEAVDALAVQGLRVLAVARGRFSGEDWPADGHGFDFEFVGLLGLADPVRPEVPAAVAECRGAGIRVVMITGDYPATARAIARQAGLAADQVLTGDEIQALDDAALRARLAQVSVCARIAPAQKLRLVQVLKDGGEVVAMTGDGVNDAPALRAAHVGVAMGGRGTDVAREAAALVLVDDNFASIVRAVRLGRRIFDNLRKAMSYILAVHVPIAGMALLPVLLGWPPLLLPMHIALLELIIDPACSLAFENEPEEPGLMQRPPRDATAPLFGGATLGLALLQGLGVLVVVMAGFAWAQQRMPEAEARAFAFAALVAGNLALILSNRSVSGSLWAAWRRPNPMLWWVLALATAATAVALYQPWVMAVLRFAPLTAGALAAAVGLGLASVLWFELLKRFWRRRTTG
jgi:Ca2+-transporting ATPase